MVINVEFFYNTGRKNAKNGVSHDSTSKLSQYVMKSRTTSCLSLRRGAIYQPYVLSTCSTQVTSTIELSILQLALFDTLLIPNVCYWSLYTSTGSKKMNKSSSNYIDIRCPRLLDELDVKQLIRLINGTKSILSCFGSHAADGVLGPSIQERERRRGATTKYEKDPC